MTAQVVAFQPGSLPILRSGFRPFFLLGPILGIVVVALWAVAYAGLSEAVSPLFSQRDWHGHEMIFGYAGAMCGGFILTALPSWAHVPEVRGPRLAVVVAIWFLGRSAMLLSTVLPPFVCAVADLLYFPALIVVVVPTVWTAENRHYRLVVPILSAFMTGNFLFHYAHIFPGTLDGVGVRVGYYSLMILFCVVAGLLTPIFTRTWFKEIGVGSEIPIRPAMEWLAAVSLLGLAAADLGQMPAQLVAAVAAAAALVHLARMRPWHSAKVLRSPLLLAMHVGYLFLVLSLALRSVSALFCLDSLSAAVHAFTLGAWGLTKFSLINRVSLKHTGRPLRVAMPMRMAFVGIGLAAVVRVVGAFNIWPQLLLPLSGLLWVAALGLFLFLYAPILVRPSLPRGLVPQT